MEIIMMMSPTPYSIAFEAECPSIQTVRAILVGQRGSKPQGNLEQQIVDQTSQPSTPVAPAVGSSSVEPPPPQADVVVTADRHASGDPLQAVNVKAFAATQAVDRNLVGPASLAYKHAVPSPIRSGIHNFLYNLREPIVLVNFVAQLKPGKAAETVGRFVVNSTVGVAGVVDVANDAPFTCHAVRTALPTHWATTECRTGLFCSFR